MSEAGKRMRARDVVHALQLVHEIYPDAVSSAERLDRIDFSTDTAGSEPRSMVGSIPVASLDLQTGCLTLTKREATFISSFPAAAIK